MGWWYLCRAQSLERERGVRNVVWLESNLDPPLALARPGSPLTACSNLPGLSYWDFILQCTPRERCMMRRWLRLNPGLSSHVDVFQQILNVQCSECLNTVGSSIAWAGHGTWDICKANLSQYLQISILLLTIRICSISSMPKHRTMIGIRIGLRMRTRFGDMTSLKVRIPTPKTKKSHTLWSIYMRAQVY